MFFKFLSPLIILTTLALMSSSANAENIIKNGSFEDHGALNQGDWGTFTSIPGWTSSSEPFEIQRGGSAGVDAFEGKDKLELDANNNSTASSMLTTEIDQSYVLKFKYSPRVEKDKYTNTNNVSVWWDDKKLKTLSGRKRGWKDNSFIVKAQSENSQLKFKGQGTSDSYGGLIDDVEVFNTACFTDNKIQNGSFEEYGELNRGSWGLFNNIPHWQVTKGSIEIQKGNIAGLEPSEGNAKAELDSDGNSTIEQTLTDLEEGERYQLILSYSPRIIDNKNTNKIRVSWNGEKVETLTDNKRGWITKTFTVTATANNILKLEARGKSDSFGGFVDDIQLYKLNCDNTNNNNLPNAFDQLISVDEDNNQEITLVATDSDIPDVLSYNISTQPLHGLLTGDAPNVTYTPEASYTGQDSFTFMVNDGTGDSNIATVSIEVLPVNNAPIALGQSLEVNEDESLSITLSGTDVDGDLITYNVVGNPNNGVLIGDAPNVVYTPSAGFNGTDSITFTVNDGQLDSALATINITIKPINDAPIALSQSLEVDEDESLSITLSGTDVDGDLITYNVVGNPNNGVLIGDAPNVVYTPSAGFNGTDSITFTVNDGQLDSAPATISITVNPINDAPVAEDQSVTVDEDTNLPVTLTGSDIDGDSLTFSVSNAPTNGTLTGDAPNLVYTPAEGFNGSDSFTFIANDRQLDSTPATISITVNPINDTPVAEGQSVTVDEDSNIPITLIATDVDGDTLSFSIVNSPANGTLTGDAPNLVYTPNTSYEGTDSFTFIANDGQLDSNEAVISIIIKSINKLPKIISTPSLQSNSNNLYEYDVEVEEGADNVLFSLLQTPENSQINSTSGVISWSPDEKYAEGITSENNYCKASSREITSSQSFADFTVVMDYSGSMNGEWEWVEDMIPSIEAGLLAEGIGTETPNYYGLMETGYRDFDDRLTMDGQLLNTYDRFVSLANGFRGSGREAGWEGMTYVLDKYPLREGSARNFILVTDEPEQSASSYTYENILQGLNDANVVLNAVLSIDVVCEATGQNAIGVDADGLGYVADGQGGYTYCSDPIINTSTSIKSDYVDLAFATGGAAWSIGQLRRGGDAAVSFSRALQEIKVREIREQLADKEIADLSINQTKLINNNLNFSLLNRGLGDSNSGKILIEVSSDNELNWQEVQSISFDTINANTKQDFNFEIQSLIDNGTHVRLSIMEENNGLDCVVENNQTTLVRIVVQAQNEVGSDIQTYWLSTLSEDTAAPKITSTPLTASVVNNQYIYQLETDDTKGDDHFFSLIEKPVGMSVDNFGGVLSWRPGINQVGSHNISIQVEDLQGNTTIQDFILETLSDGSVDDGPLLIENIGVINFNPNTEVTYLPQVDSSSNSSLTYTLLTSAPECTLISTGTGEVSCNFGTEIPLIRGVFIKVEDQFGRYAIQYVVINNIPYFNSTPDELVIVKADKSKRFIYSVTDPDGDAVTIQVISNLEAVTENARDFYWTPSTDLIGQTIPITVRAVDIYGGYAEHNFEAQIVTNQDPYFTSTPIEKGTSGRTYTYYLSAIDPDGDSLTYNLLSAPEELEFSSRRITWDIPVGQEGQYTIEAEVVDEDGARAIQSYTLAVEANKAPEFTSNPGLEAVSGQIYTYYLRATDPESDRITYSLGDTPEGITLSGTRLNWTPSTGQIGSQEITVIATDLYGASTEQVFILSVTGNQIPTITSIPNLTAISLHNYRYYVRATDPESRTMSYEIITAPDGMTITGTRIDWIPSNNQLGFNNVAVKVTDDVGNSVTQSFSILVQKNQPPSITSLAIDKLVTGHSYSYYIRATDPDGDGVTYEFISGPEGMSISGYRITWIPTEEQIGKFDVTVRARDAYDGVVSQDFSIDVTANNVPEFTSTPPGVAIVGQLFRYYVSATEPDSDGITYELETAPLGVTLTGSRVDWTPTPDQVGTNTIRVLARDNYGGESYQDIVLEVSESLIFMSKPENESIEATRYYSSDAFTARDANNSTVAYRLISGPDALRISGSRVYWTPTVDQLGDHTVVVEAYTDLDTVQTSWTLTVTERNEVPVITSSAITTTTVDELYSYQVEAEDADGDILSYSLLIKPEGMTIDENTGLIRWTPAENQASSFTVRIVVSDSKGAQILQTYTLRVNQQPNTPPEITSTPPTKVYIGELYRYQIEAVDSEGDEITYRRYRAPSGMTVNTATGEVLWTPTISQIGEQVVELDAIDDRNEYSRQTYNVVVSDGQNEIPVISSEPNLTAYVDEPYVYNVIVSDADGDNLVIDFSDSPIGMTINSATGEITWTPTESQLGDQTVTVRVSDGRETAEQSFVLTVLEPLPKPLNVIITVTPQVINLGETATINVKATGGSISTRVTMLTIDGVDTSIDDSGNATYTPTSIGRYELLVTATDENETSEDVTYLKVPDPNDSIPPVVNITNLSLFEVTEVKSPIEIKGSVEEDNLDSWRLLLSTKNSSPDEFSVLAEGSTSFEEQTIITLDPTQLLNGMYEVILEATDLSGQTSLVNPIVLVDGDLKVGNFSISFEDLSIPTAGIPLTITRTYDTRQRFDSQDFGFGWSLGYENIRVQENRTPGFGWLTRTYPKGPLGLTPDVCVESASDNVVSVTMSDGEVLKFKAKAEPECNTLIPLLDVNLVFESLEDDNGAKLEALDNNFGRLINGSIDDIGAGVIDPTRYKLTTEEGRELIIDQTDGIKEIYESEGENRITISREGIVHSAGPTVTFERDSNDRIIKIISPDGSELNYSYTVEGDLNAFTNRAAETTTFTYLNNPNLPHYLEDIIDPRGIRVARNIYDDDGRLTAHVDADGNRIEYEHDITGRIETVKDRNGNSTIFAYNDRGDVVAQTNAEGETTTRSYNEYGYELSRTDALGNTQSWDYDNVGNQLTETDALGNITTSTYRVFNQFDTLTDALGRVVVDNFYSNRTVAGVEFQPGPLRSIKDANGNAILLQYNSQGLPSSIQDVGLNSSKTEYNASGFVTASIDALGVRTDYTVDEMGNRLTETTTRTNAAGETETLTTTHVYDTKDNLIQTTDALGNVSSMEYSSINKMTAEIDANGNRTEHTYDSRGNQITTTFADGSSMSMTYDAENNKLTDTDRLGRTTTYVYDKVNRLIETILPDATPADLTDNPRTQTEYDDAGRVSAAVDANGNRTTYGYDAAGRRTSVTDALGNISTYVYDAVGNQTSFTDANSNTMSFEYDDLDRRTKTTYADGSSKSVGYDTLGRKISETDQAGVSTNYAYDALGRLIKVTDVQANETSYAYDEQGNKISQTDAEGRTTQWSYDKLGRVISRTLPLGQVENMTYDAVGNVITKTDFNSQTATMVYDVTNRLSTSSYADGQVDGMVYDAVGNRTQATITDTTGTRTYAYSYDSRNRLITETQADATVLEYQYDNQSNRTQLKSSKGSDVKIVGYGFDSLNRLSTVTDSIGITRYAYDAVGNRSAINHANGNIDSYVYDSLNRLNSLTHKNSADAVLSSFTYTLDATGKRTKIVEQSGRTTDYTYDNLKRLETEDITDATNGNYNASYIYDKVGNRTYETKDGVQTQYTIDDNDRLSQQGGTTYIYDNNGSTLSETLDGNSKTFTYNAKNQLIQTSNAGTDTGYQYNADGIREAQTTGIETTQYIVDTNRAYAQVIKESVNNSTTVEYTYGDDLLSQTRNGQSNTYHYDGLGSTRTLSDVAGAITDSYDYEAFGEKLNVTGTTENSYLYAGEQFDQGLGKYYLRARYYDQGVGRFTQQDTWMGNNSDPITLHKYLYGNADPVNHTDPSGYFGLSDISIGMNGQAMLATRAVGSAGLRSGVNKAITATLQVSGRATSKLALRKLRKCIRQKNKCGLNANILVVGYDNPDMVDHIRDAQSLNPRTFVLTYMKNKKGNRQWYRNSPGCRLSKKTAGSQCDEYPFFKTREGGPTNRASVSLRWVPGGQNMSVGGHFGFLARNMRTPKNNKFIVVTSTNLPTIALPMGKK